MQALRQNIKRYHLKFQLPIFNSTLDYQLFCGQKILTAYFSSASILSALKMSFQTQFDPSQQGQYQQDGGNGMAQGPPPQAMQQGQQQMQPQQGQDGGSPAPFAQQGGPGGAEGSGGSVTGDAKTTLW